MKNNFKWLIQIPLGSMESLKGHPVVIIIWFMLHSQNAKELMFCGLLMHSDQDVRRALFFLITKGLSN